MQAKVLKNFSNCPKCRKQISELPGSLHIFSGSLVLGTSHSSVDCTAVKTKQNLL